LAWSAAREWMPPSDVRGALVIVDPRPVGDDTGIVMRALIAQRLAAAGAAAMLIQSDKPGRMVYTSAFGFYPNGPLPVADLPGDALKDEVVAEAEAVTQKSDIATMRRMLYGSSRRWLQTIPACTVGLITSAVRFGGVT
jgi:hypothetical protein